MAEQESFTNIKPGRSGYPWCTEDAHRRGGFQQHEQDDCGADSHARAASEIRQDRQADEKILCARRTEPGETRGHCSHHGNAAAE